MSILERKESDVPIFENADVMKRLFGELWTKMINETEFGSKLKENGITILFRIKDPEVLMFVDENGPLFGEEAEAKVPVVTMMMDGNTVHGFWLRQVNIPKALALRQIKAKGPVGKVLQILPLVKPGYQMYPTLCRQHGIPLNVE